MDRKGQALIVAYTVITVFIIIVGALTSSSLTQKNAALRNKYLNEAFSLSEGAIEYGIANFTNAIANYVIDANISSYNVNSTFTTFGSSNITIQVNFTSMQASDTTITEGQTYIKTRNYLINATAVHPQDPSITVTIHQIIARRLIPTFQHAVFYNDDLEILPGANMNLSGRIHCNQDMYLDSDGATLKINSTYVHSAGNIYNQRKDTGAELSGEVSIRINKTGSAKYENMDNLDCDSANWTTESTDLWNGSVQSAVHGVTKLSAPAVASIQAGGYYSSQAGCVITNDQAIVNGTTLVNGVNCPNNTITNSSTLYNTREGEYIKTTNIDIGKLANLDNEVNATGIAYPNYLPSNGLIYATRNDASASQEEAIRLINADQIERTAGLTIVSDKAVYVQGDFNIVSEKPASIICDSINLLSNSWNDTNSKNWSKRSTTATIYNCAFIAGVDTTTSANYNGGLENYPRLLENWAGTSLTIKGSFVELWNSSQATGKWVYGNPQYSAPTRNWSYNTMYNDPTKLPPFTPWAVEARRIAWWKD
ncbi:MAG TPA: hypothetical protein PKL77_07005 [Candidatus Omnitrophota bacterium]|nr:hypothetical protein [Candidatus Omnitrophota bacterium]HPT07604.1 hypothetical protein [Candidatus Omnitrophota bacterium]